MGGGSTRIRKPALIAGVVTSAALLACIFTGLDSFLHGDSSAPFEYLPLEWNARVTITNDEAAVEVRLLTEVLKTRRGKPALIPLFPAGTVFRNVRMNGEALVPVRRGDWHYAEIARAGRYEISAGLDLKPRYDAGDHVLALPKPASARAGISVVSGAALEVRATGAQEVITGSAAAGTSGRLELGPAAGAELLWRKPRPDVAHTGTPSVKPSIAWKIGERVLSASALLNVEIMGGRADRLSLELPAGVDNLRISGAHVRDFRRAGSSLTVYFPGAISGSTSIRISFDVPRGQGDTVSCPMPVIADGRVEPGGWILVYNEARGLLLENRTDGLRQASDLDVPAEALGLSAGTPLFVYECTDRAAQPVFDLVTRTPFPLVDTIADRADIISVVRPDGDEMTRVSLRIRNNVRQYLRVVLPEGARVVAAEVDRVPVALSREGSVTMVPLTKSIQTLGGLIPFPVELTYCRKGAPFAAGRKNRLDLPELPDVPVTIVNVAAFCPEDIVLRGCSGTLKQVDSFSSPAADWLGGTSMDATPLSVGNALALNYYNAGYKAYRENRLEQAETYLSGAVGAKPDAVQAKLAADLLGNIRMGRGEGKGGQSRLDRAKAAQIRKELTSDNGQLEVKQAALIENGLKTLETGDQELGVELLEMADEIGNQITTRGGARSRQDSIRRQYDRRLAEARKDRDTNRELERKVGELQGKARAMVNSAEGAKDRDAQASRMAAALVNAQAGANMNAAEVQSTVFGSAFDKDNPQRADVSKKALAKQFGEELNVANGSWQVQTIQQQRLNLKTRNDYLSRQTQVLEQVVNTAATDSYSSSWGNRGGASVVSEITDQARKAKEKLVGIISNLTAGRESVASTDDVKVSAEIDKLNEWTAGNATVYGQLDESLKKEFGEINSQIAVARQELESARKTRQNASQVAVDLKGWGVRDNNGGNQIAEFVAWNYLAPGTNAQGRLIEADNGRLIVTNSGAMPEKVQQVVEKLQLNDGQVVPVSAVRIPAVQAAGAWLTNGVSGQRRFGVLDEAQYNTLIMLGGVNSKAGELALSKESRDVVVGTGNELAGQAFSLVSSDGGASRFKLGEAQVDLPLEKYLVVQDGAMLAVLKAGAIRNWQEKGEVKISTAVPRRIEIPLIGRQFRFEKTLLGAGESADIELTM